MQRFIIAGAIVLATAAPTCAQRSAQTPTPAATPTPLAEPSTPSGTLYVNTLRAAQYLAIDGHPTGSEPSSPRDSMLVYDSTTKSYKWYNGSVWTYLGGGGSGGGSPTGTAGGDLNGTYPNPTVDGLQGRAVAATAPTTSQVLQWNGTAWTPGTVSSGSGPPTGAASGDLGGTYPNPTVTGLQGRSIVTTTPTNGQSLVFNGTSWAPSTISGGSGPPTGAASGDLGGTYPSPTVTKIQGQPVSSTAPTNGQLLIWSGTSYVPGDPVVSQPTASLLNATVVGPSGAALATSANQTTGNTSLSTMLTNMGQPSDAATPYSGTGSGNSIQIQSAILAAAKSGTGAAGTPSSSVVSVQGNASGIPVPVTQSGAVGAYNATITPVSLAVKLVTTGGTAVTAMTAGQRTKGGWFKNPDNATTSLCINEMPGGTASGTSSNGDTTCIGAGSTYQVLPNGGAVSVVTSDSNHPFSGMGYN